MRKLKLQVQMTIDGFITGTKGEMDWMTYPWSEDIKKYVNEITEPVDTIILGKNLAEGFIPHWASIPEGEDKWFIGKMNDSKKIVFTKTLEQSTWDKKTELAKGELIAEITKLKNQTGKDIIVYGGATFVSALIKGGLIDELYLFINPTAIGNGMPIFKELESKQDFHFVKSISFDCGIVVLNYELKK